jgi:hypothetical protein
MIVWIGMIIFINIRNSQQKQRHSTVAGFLRESGGRCLHNHEFAQVNVPGTRIVLKRCNCCQYELNFRRRLPPRMV